MNRVILVGRMSREPELKSTTSGTPVLDFPIALNDRTKRSDGEWVTTSVFVDCTAFGRTAETIAEHCPKGAPLGLEGRLTVDQWQDRDTQQMRYRTKVIVEKMEFLPKPK